MYISLLSRVLTVQKTEEDIQCSDPEIEAWLNEGDGEDVEKTMDTSPLVDDINDNDCDDSRCMAVIENNSELTYHDDGNMCIISDSMIAKMMKKMAKKNKKGDDLLDTIEEDEFEEEVKPKKMNRNSRALKKVREERKMQAQKAKEEKERKEREQIKELSQKPVSKFNYDRPTKKTNSSLQNLAKKKISQKNKK